MKKNNIKKLLDDAFEKIRDVDKKTSVNNISENIIKQLINAPYCSIWKVEAKDGILTREKSPRFVNEISIEDSKGLFAKAILTKKAYIYKNVSTEKEFFAHIDNHDNIKIKSLLLFPLIDNDELIGILSIYTSIMHSEKEFSNDDLETLEAMSPFLLNILYKMHFEKDFDRRKRGKTKEKSKDNEDLNVRANDAVVELEKIEELRKHRDTPATILNSVSTIASDIKIPAYNTLVFLNLLEDQIEDPRLIKYIKDAKNSVSFIEELSRSLLDRVYTQRDRKSSDIDKVNTIKFISDISDMFSPIMLDKHIDYNIYIDPLLPKEIIVNSFKIKKVLVNLINNAYKYTRKNGLVEFFVISHEEQIKFIVKDNGIGITDEKKEKIFKSFKETHHKSKMDNLTSEFGLSASALYIEDCGGELKLKTKLSIGSSFSFLIPLNSETKECCFEPRDSDGKRVYFLADKKDLGVIKNMMKNLLSFGIVQENISIVNKIDDVGNDCTHIIIFDSKFNSDISKTIKKMDVKSLVVEDRLFQVQSKIYDTDMVVSKHSYYGNHLYVFVENIKVPRVLVVDDDRISIAIMNHVLGEILCEVDSGSDGKEGLEMLQLAYDEGNAYDIVFLDMRMPFMSGAEVIQAYKKYAKELNSIYSISISGDKLDGKKEGTYFSKNIGKPVNKKEVQDIVLAYSKK